MKNLRRTLTSGRRTRPGEVRGRHRPALQRISGLSALALTTLLAGCAVHSAGVVASRDVFFVGGTYVGDVGQQVMRGAMYVEHIKPPGTRQKYPLVLISGTAQTAVNWMTTPDGRKGWAQYFVEQGYEVYLVDQPARGRSAWNPGVDGPLRSLPVHTAETLFTGSMGDWPQAQFHTQWPGSGKQGDPVFDQFYASQVAYIGSKAQTQTAMQVAGSALLDRIGPAVLVTHSQAGPFGWLIADARPSLVKAIVAIEPQGPPIQAGQRKTAAWGLADIGLQYTPAIDGPGDLRVEQQEIADAPGLQTCWTQQDPVHQLTNLQAIPIAVLTTQASYHAAFDHCTVKWMRQAGSSVEFIRLEELGILGNGHMVMLEMNNIDVAAVIKKWVQKSTR